MQSNPHCLSHGVVVSILGLDYPYFVGRNVIVPALLTNNAVLYNTVMPISVER